ncbi:electron transporter RnfE [Sulfurifustis variabilis]|uniref:Electron transporter RnfE n=1 Tax=Sulfurifustis variabilis TaxID=1675686 RepID=A0A1C7AEV6_9GAMM|nr:SHOCT domain-containing protein [Sulfurifustis variabilis]BAU49712.1 electron transporter RnfE [Sulfurifustis variabilis]
MWGDGGYWWWGFGALHMLLYWGLLILLIVALVKWVFGTPGRNDADRHDERRALAILKERYARGDIGKEEFEQKKRDLQA